MTGPMGQHEEDGVLYCDEHGTFQCRACGHDPQPKRLEAQGAMERTGRVGCERADGLLNIHPESETCEVCAPTPPTPAGEDAQVIDLTQVVLIDGLGCKRKPHATPEADGGKAAGHLMNGHLCQCDIYATPSPADGAEGLPGELEAIRIAGTDPQRYSLYTRYPNGQLSKIGERYLKTLEQAESALADALVVIEALGVTVLTPTANPDWLTAKLTDNPEAIAAFKRLSARRRA